MVLLCLKLVIPYLSSTVNIHITPNCTFGLSTDSISLGPLELTASVGMPLLDLDSWVVDGPTMCFTLQAAEHVTGILGDCTLVLARNSPWSLTLDLPSFKYGSFIRWLLLLWVQPPIKSIYQQELDLMIF